jgi:antitoxin ParD1/3/4
MSKVEKMSISLTDKLATEVRVAVESGDYASASDVIRDALRLWQERREARAAKLADLRAAWNEGIASGVAAERETLEDFLARNRKRLADVKRGAA